MKPPVINIAKCIHCGAEFGLHRSGYSSCPLHGIEETRDGVKQRWADTVFETNAPDPLVRELSTALNDVLSDISNQVDHIENQIHSCEGVTRTLMVSAWGEAKERLNKAKAALIKAGYTEI